MWRGRLLGAVGHGTPIPHSAFRIPHLRSIAMTQYLLRRLAITVPVLLGITIATYAIISFAPGDPVTALISPEAAASLGPGWVEQQREALGLNKPVPVRYALWLKEVAQGNLGFSL